MIYQTIYVSFSSQESEKIRTRNIEWFGLVGLSSASGYSNQPKAWLAVLFMSQNLIQEVDGLTKEIDDLKDGVAKLEEENIEALVPYIWVGRSAHPGHIKMWVKNSLPVDLK